MKIKVTTSCFLYAYVPELGHKAQCEYRTEEFVDIPDERFLYLEGYAPTNAIYDAGNPARNRGEVYWDVESEICEEGLAKDIPWLSKPFESVEEMREFLSREDVIAEFEDE